MEKKINSTQKALNKGKNVSILKSNINKKSSNSSSNNKSMNSTKNNGGIKTVK